MTETMLSQTPPHEEKTAHKTSLISSLLTIALAIALIILGEKLLFDVNRWFNPAPLQYGLPTVSLQETFIPSAEASELATSYSAELPTSPVPTSGVPSSYTRQDYETYRLLLHAAVIIPLFLLMFLFYYFMRFKRASSPYRIISYAYICFAFWLIVRLLGELCYYMIENYKTAGVYVVLFVLIVVFTVLIMAIQKKMHAAHQT